jgi:hypothetical protein
MKKTIAAMALTVASTGFALMPPVAQTKTYCLSQYEAADGSKVNGTCDNTANNQAAGLKNLANGCPAGQAALTAMKFQGGTQYDINIYSCMPPNVVQL